MLVPRPPTINRSSVTLRATTRTRTPTTVATGISTLFRRTPCWSFTLVEVFQIVFEPLLRLQRRPELASYLRIEEREPEAGGMN